MNKGRPEGWDTERERRRNEEDDDGDIYASDWYDGYEGGADAILEALISNKAMRAMLLGFMIANDWVIGIEAKESYGENISQSSV